MHTRSHHHLPHDLAAIATNTRTTGFTLANSSSAKNQARLLPLSHSSNPVSWNRLHSSSQHHCSPPSSINPSAATATPCTSHKGTIRRARLRRFNTPSPHILRSRCPIRPSRPTPSRKPRSRTRTSRPPTDAEAPLPTCKPRPQVATNDSHLPRFSRRLVSHIPVRRTASLVRAPTRATFPEVPQGSSKDGVPLAASARKVGLRS